MKYSTKHPLQISMSTLSALYAVSAYKLEHPHATLDEIIVSLQRSDSDLSAVNFSGAAALYNALDLPAPDEPVRFFRAVLTTWISHVAPWWLRLFPYGRERVLTALTLDETQCFRSASLLQDPPATEIYQWWDHLAGLRRAAENAALAEQGREAERWSLSYEFNRLKKLGITAQPRWIAIEDNSAGFDIRSYDLGLAEPITRLIEVKSSTQSPPRIIISRNEWETALQFGDRYFFHIWSIQNNTLAILSAFDIEKHIPKDQGIGRWTEVTIQISDESLFNKPDTWN